MPLSPQEELELIELEQESRRRQAPVEPQAQDPRGMNFTPDPTAESVRQQFKEPGEFIPSAELQQAIEPLAAGVVGGLTSDVIAPPQKMIEEAPGRVASGEVLGGIAQAAVLPAKKVFDAASGAVSGFNTAQGGLPQKLMGGLFGAGINVLGGSAAKGISKGATAAAKGVSKLATQAGEGLEKLALGIKQSDVFRFAAKGKKQAGESVSELVSTLKNAGIFKRGASPEALEQSLNEISQNAGLRLERSFAKLDETGHALPTEELLGKIDEELSRLKQFPEGFSDKITRLESFRNDLAVSPAANASQLRTMTQIVADEAFDKSGTIVDNEAFKVWQSLKDATDNLANSVGGTLGDELREANKLYATTVKARPAIARKAASQEAGESLRKQATGLVDKAATRAVSGSVEWVKKNSDKLSKMKLYGPILHGAASRGPQALAATYYRLSQQYPDFKEQVEALDE